MFCTNCGTAHQGDSNYCGSCGAGFAVAKSDAAPTTLVAQGSAAQPSSTFTSQVVVPAVQANITDIYYWVLATSPIAVVIFDAVLTNALGQNASAAIGTFIAIVFVLAAVSIDSSQLRKLGIRVPFWMGAVLPPLYLFKRAKATGRNQAAFITWLAIYALLIVLTIAGY
jgi:hypothetical protein